MPADPTPLSRSARYRRVLESLTIRDEHGQLVPLRFSESQELLWKPVAEKLDANERLWFVVLKGRQVYATTFFAALSFVRTTEKPNTDALVVANRLDTASDIFGMYKRFYEHLPLPKLKPSRVKEIELPFPGGTSRIRVTSAGLIAKGRGGTRAVCHNSEVAYFPQPEVLVSLFNSIPAHVPDTIWVLESTANGLAGVGRAFYDEWKAAVDGRSALTPIFIPWFVMKKYRLDAAIPEDEWDDEEQLLVEQFGAYGLDGHALAWRRFAIETRTQGSPELFRQEFPSTPEEAFLSSGLPAFESHAILAQQKYIRPPAKVGVMHHQQLVPATRGWLSVWREPDDGHQYVIGVDTSTGVKGGDYACAQVLDMGTLEQVAVLHGLITPWELAQQVAQLGKWYNTAIVAVEVLRDGRAVQDYLIRVLHYPNLHVWRGRSDAIRPQKATLYGWETNSVSRPLLIEAGRRAINAGLVVIHDRGTLDEISRFSLTDTGRYEAETGHDDRVLALLIALRSREENYAPAKRAVITPSEYQSFVDVLPHGVRVLTPYEDGFALRRQAHLDLARRAHRAARHWTAY